MLESCNSYFYVENIELRIKRMKNNKNFYFTGEGARTSAILIASPQAILAEQYKAGFTPETAQRTWSVAKSIGASIIGVAVEQKRLDVTKPAGLKNWSHPLDPRGEITLENLLHMASGLDSNKAGNRTDRVYMGGGLVSDTATHTAPRGALP